MSVQRAGSVSGQVLHQLVYVSQDTTVHQVCLLRGVGWGGGGLERLNHTFNRTLLSTTPGMSPQGVGWGGGWKDSTTHLNNFVKKRL